MNFPRDVAESMTLLFSRCISLACYHCQLGEMETAKRYLKKFLKLIGTGEKQRWMMRI